MLPANRCPTVTALSALLTLLATASTTSAQCPTSWRTGGGFAGTNDDVNASVMWDRDGSGPVPPVLVIGGRFAFVGDQPANCLAAFDPATNTWSTLGQGVAGGNIPGQVAALAVLPNGHLVAAGLFATAGGLPANNIARWDGSSWSALGAGITATGTTAQVYSMTVDGNGDLIVGGRFDAAGGSPATGVARWNGAAWSAMGSPLGGDVTALVTLPNGTVVAGSSSGSSGAVRQWTGAAWVDVGPTTLGNVTGLAAAPNGDVIAAGSLSRPVPGGHSYVSRWDGTTWTALATQCTGSVTTVSALANGVVMAGGRFSSLGGQPAIGVAQWNGTNWLPMGAGLGLNNSGTGFYTGAHSFTFLPDGSVVAGGSFLNAGSVSALHVARWQNGAWLAMTSTSSPPPLTALVATPGGGFVAGYPGLAAGGTLSPGAARWDGSQWQPMPGIAADSYTRVSSLFDAPGIGLLAGGWFRIAGNQTLANVARWTGTAWVPFGPDFGGEAHALARLSNGDVVVGSDLFSMGYIARSNGGPWSTLGGGTNGTVFALHRLANGDLIAGGNFSLAGGVLTGGIARWNGASWSDVGGGVSGPVFVRAIAELPDGSLVVGGAFALAGGAPAANIALWTGSSWLPMSSGMNAPVDSVVVLPDGDVLAGGSFTLAGGVPVAGVARWRGGTWQPVGLGVRGQVFAMAVGTSGEVAVGGAFASANGNISPSFARLVSGCPASVTSTSTPCVGSAGPLVTTAASLPWLGTTFRSRTQGFAVGSLAAIVVGLTPNNIPLSSLHPSGLPGCALLTSTEHLQFAIPSAAGVDVAIPVPDAPALVGATVLLQILQAELNGQGSMVALSSSNRLQIQAGDF